MLGPPVYSVETSLLKRVKTISSEEMEMTVDLSSEGASLPKRMKLISSEKYKSSPYLLSEGTSFPKRMKHISSDENERTLNLPSEELLLRKRRKLISSEVNEWTSDLLSEDASFPKRMKFISSEDNECGLGHLSEENAWTFDGISSHSLEASSMISQNNQGSLVNFREKPQICDSESSSDDSALSGSSTFSNFLDPFSDIEPVFEMCCKCGEEACDSDITEKDSEPQIQETISGPIATSTSEEKYGEGLKKKFTDVSKIVVLDHYLNPNTRTCRGRLSSLMKFMQLTKNHNGEKFTDIVPPSKTIPDVNTQNTFSSIYPTPDLQGIDWSRVREELRRSGVNEAVQGIRLFTLRSKSEDRLKLRRLALNWNIDINLF